MSRIIDDLYLRLNGVATELTAELGRTVTLREALLRLFGAERMLPGDLAWSWRFQELAKARGEVAGRNRPVHAETGDVSNFRKNYT